MSDLPQSVVCPFGELLDRRILGDFSPEDREKLDAHLRGGCPACAERWKVEEGLEGLIHRAIEPLAQEAEKRRVPVLEKLQHELEREDEFRRERRRRRIGMNAVLFLIVALGVTLLSVEYFAYATMRKKLVRAQRVAAETEIRAISFALIKLSLEQGHAVVPTESGGLLTALSRKRTDVPGRVYYTVDPARIDGTSGLLLDPWGHPYGYKRVGDIVTIHSWGQNGVDDAGGGDDIGVSAILAK